MWRGRSVTQMWPLSPLACASGTRYRGPLVHLALMSCLPPFGDRRLGKSVDPDPRRASGNGARPGPRRRTMTTEIKGAASGAVEKATEAAGAAKARAGEAPRARISADAIEQHRDVSALGELGLRIVHRRRSPPSRVARPLAVNPIGVSVCAAGPRGNNRALNMNWRSCVHRYQRARVGDHHRHPADHPSLAARTGAAGRGPSPSGATSSCFAQARRENLLYDGIVRRSE